MVLFHEFMVYTIAIILKTIMKIMGGRILFI